MKILFVCIGNICRSPMAEGIMKSKIEALNLPWEVDSAGTHNYHTGEPPHLSSTEVCKNNGIDITYQRSRQLTEHDFEHFDIIFSLATDVHQTILSRCTKEHHEPKVKLLLDEIYPGQNKSVKDPWYGDHIDYEEVFEEMSRACDAIIKSKIKH